MNHQFSHAGSLAHGGLSSFRDPSSVAVVGATDDQAKWGYWLARGALTGSERRRVWLVNRTATHVQGVEAFPSVAALPQVPELVVLCVPAAHIAGVIEESLDLGVRAFLAITAGVDNGALLDRVRETGARIVGPNSLGLYDAATELQLAWGNFEPGKLAIISQSGQLGSEIANLAARGGLGVSRFVSVGNQLDVQAAELLDDLADHDATELVALYLESFSGGEQLIETVQRLRAAGKQTVLLATGASEGSQRLAASHTGSMTSTLDAVDAACRAAGAVRVSTPTELVNLARYLDVAPSPHGRRIAVVSDSGGQGGIAADLVAAVGLDTPIFSAELQKSLAEVLPTGASVANPIDLAGAGEADLHTYAELCERLVASGEVDAVLLSGYFGCYGEDAPSIEAIELDVVDRMGRLVGQGNIPLVVHTMSAGSPVVDRMWEHHIPVFGAVEVALQALAHAQHLNQHPGRTTTELAAADLGVRPGYWAAREVLTEAKIAVPAAALVQSATDVPTAAAVLAAPYVLKAGWLAHKSEHGGVVLGLKDATELLAAYEDMHSRLGDGEYVVEEQDRSANVVEVLVGARRDRDFGPMITVGAGGTEAELWRDIRLEVAPVDRAQATQMIRSLRSNALLEGWRGRPAVDVESLAEIVASVSRMVCADPTITDLELNPIRVSPDGALVVDALITQLEED